MPYDLNIRSQAMRRIRTDLAELNSHLDTWHQDCILSTLNLALTHAYQQGMREAFLLVLEHQRKKWWERWGDY